MLNQYFKSILDLDKNPIMICDLDCNVLYTNYAANKQFRRDLTGANIKNCHNENSNAIISKIIAWFEKSTENNYIYMYKDQANRDVYMVAIRDGGGKLIGFYERYEVRTPEEGSRYAFD